MRTDPNKACANERQRLLWALLHDALAHPLMALSGYSKWALRFHDYTSHKAWPRTVVPRVLTHDLDKLLALEEILRANDIAFVSTGRPVGNAYIHTLELM